MVLICYRFLRGDFVASEEGRQLGEGGALRGFKFLPHIAFQVKNYDEAVDFYQKVLGLSFISRKENETILKCGDVTFYVENSPNGNTFLAFEVDNLEEARKALIAAGAKVSEYVDGGYMVSDSFGLKFHLSPREVRPS